MRGTGYVLGAIAVSAAVTYLLRGAVFLFFRGSRKMPEWLERLGGVLPSAVMAVLVVYCLRGVRDDFPNTGIPGLLAAALTVLVHRWKHNTFLSLLLGTGVYMVLIRLM